MDKTQRSLTQGPKVSEEVNRHFMWLEMIPGRDLMKSALQSSVITHLWEAVAAISIYLGNTWGLAGRALPVLHSPITTVGTKSRASQHHERTHPI